RDGGIGGLDLYTSSMTYGQWREARILPEPLNSPADDFSYILELGTSDGYFTSNRGRNDDIYRARSLIVRKVNCDPLVVEDYCFAFWETNRGKFDTIPFIYEWDFGDGNTATGDTVEHCFEDPGKYSVKMYSIDTVQNTPRKLQETRIIEVEKTIQAFIDAPDTCNVGEVITFDGAQTFLPELQITEYYWNFDDGTIARGISAGKVFTEAGTYLVQLIVKGKSEDDSGIDESCVSKYIYVREDQ
ncbi:MAG: PKD domain-containing protein, partial [Clostridia bacterium]|nr:PKD domain-containing protein [Clostridia bacterium]